MYSTHAFYSNAAYQKNQFALKKHKQYSLVY